MKGRLYQLQAFIQPFELRPSFIIPIFSYRDKLYTQEIDDKYIIQDFRPFESDIIPYKSCDLYDRVYVKFEDQAIFGFIFEDGEKIFGDKSKLSNVFIKKTHILAKYPYACMDVLKFLNDKNDPIHTVYQLRNLIKFSDEINADEITALELKLIDQKTRLLQASPSIMERMKFLDDNKYINYWNLLPEIRNLIGHYSQVYIKVKLLRSPIGKSPSIRDTLRYFNLYPRKIGAESKFIIINSNNFDKIHKINNLILITDIRVYGEKTIDITPCDVVNIMKRYLKKDRRKVVKGKSHGDYICSILESMPQLGQFENLTDREVYGESLYDGQE